FVRLKQLHPKLQISSAVGIPVLILFLVGKPYSRGFYCDDDSIRYPYKDSTVPNGLLYTYAIGLPVVGILVIEGLHFHENRSTRNYRVLMFNVYCKLVVFAFGALVSQLLTDIAKYSIGRLRPHFYDVCQPNVYCKENDHTYYDVFDCKGNDEKKIKDAKLSFMSGHSSFSAFCMVYLALYIQARAKWRFLGLVKPLLQVLLVYVAIYVGFSRISDYKHHWSDVLIGLIQGTIVAFLIAYYVSDLFKSRNVYVPDDAESPNPVNDSTPINYNSCALEPMQKAV
ncbi:phosphatidate phosphatase-like protein, partial [Leptotrombidium deliense]